MRTDSSAPPPTNEQPGAPSQGVRSVVSLVLFLHLFCVFVALSTNHNPSDTALSFLRISRLYTQQFNFDLFVEYNLTTGFDVDSNHRIEVLPRDANPDDPSAWVALPDVGLRGGERRARYERLAQHMDFFVQNEREEHMALVASTVGEYFWKQRNVAARQIRCRRHVPVPLEAYLIPGFPQPRDPESPTYYASVYAANALIDDETGLVEVVKIESAGQTAGPTGNP